MSLAAELPGIELYRAIISAFQGRLDLIKDGVPVILESPIIFQGKPNAWGSNDAIVVVSETTDEFCVILKGVKVISPGTLYFRNSRMVLAYLKKQHLLQDDIAINIQGIFAGKCVHGNQLVLEGPGFNEFVELGDDLPFIGDAVKQILRKKIAEIDSNNTVKGSVVTHQQAKKYERNKELAKLLKELRGSKCQICGYTFETIDGEHYSECHHLEHLADSGLDISKNMLVMCANCHRKMHYGKVKILEHTESHVLVELDGVAHNCPL